MSGTQIPVLVFAVTFGIATLSHDAGATPQQGDDGQTVGASEPGVPASRMVALGVRRVAIADPDLDGIVSPAEAKKYYATRFALMDRDRDGRLSEAEFFRVGTSRSLQALDSFSDPRPLSFEAVDVDGSGALTPEEFLRADVARRSWAIGAQSEAGRRSIFDAADTNGDGAQSEAGRRSIFDAADTNGDGALSKQELTEAGSRHFAASDANGDGRVTIWEFYGGTRF